MAQVKFDTDLQQFSTLDSQTKMYSDSGSSYALEEAPLVAGTVFTGFEFELPTPPVALEWIPFEPQGSYILQRVDEGFSLESQRHGSRHSHSDFVRRVKKKKPSRPSKNDDSGEPGKTTKNKKDYEPTTQELLVGGVPAQTPKSRSIC